MKRFLLIVACLILAALCLIWFGGRWILSYSVAEYAGELSVSHLQHRVDITFDAKGIPQIWAETQDDAFLSMGWLHASERLFQMELIRRMSTGELAELFGEFAYEIDLFQRKIGTRRIAQRGLKHIDAETLHLLERYCQGINAWIKHKMILPIEFIVLNETPRLWTPLDCLTVMLYQTWFTMEESDLNKEHHLLLEKFGEGLAQYLQEPFLWSPPTIRNHPLSPFFKHTRFPFQMAKASNSWVVSPDKSTTGAALHASDPHLEIYQIPGLWYIMGIHSQEGLHFLGVTAPGLPFGVMGHNGTIAYAFTLAGVDVTDYYRYQRHPDDKLKILTENGYQPLTRLQEEIQVAGEENPRQVEIYTTPRGVVVEETPTAVVALKWAGSDFDAGETMESAFAIMKSQNFSEFQKAVTGVGAFNVNWTYSDIQGNIGYQLGTPIPKRRYANTFQHVSGADPATAWQGYYSLSETPYAYNPPEGWLASCNNQIVPEDWSYPLPGFYGLYRITRAETLLARKENHSPQDMRKMQMDLVSGIALRWKALLASAAKRLGQQALAEQITAWNGEMSLDEPTSLLFFFWWNALPQFIFEDDLGEDYQQGASVLEFTLTYEIEAMLDDQQTPEHQETLEEIAAMTLKHVLPEAQGKTLRDVSLYEIDHPLAEIKILDVWLALNRGPFYVGGDGGSLNVNWLWHDEESGKYYTVAGPSMRYVLDWADIDAFTIHILPGQSGNPLSPHYADFIDIWLTGSEWIVSFSREKVYNQKASLLKLLPQNNL